MVCSGSFVFVPERKKGHKGSNTSPTQHPRFLLREKGNVRDVQRAGPVEYAARLQGVGEPLRRRRVARLRADRRRGAGDRVTLQ